MNRRGVRRLRLLFLKNAEANHDTFAADVDARPNSVGYESVYVVLAPVAEGTTHFPEHG
jgi:hypothetical protein